MAILAVFFGFRIARAGSGGGFRPRRARGPSYADPSLALRQAAGVKGRNGAFALHSNPLPYDSLPPEQ